MKLQDAIKTTQFKNEQSKAAINILYTAYWFKTHLSAILKKNALTQEQYNVLRILKIRHPEPLCVKEIAERMLEKSSNVPRIIDRLVSKELVIRFSSERDKRETLVSMTGKGESALTSANKGVERLNKSIIGISEEEAVLLNELLERTRKVD